jgi:hypothetical protein
MKRRLGFLALTFSLLGGCSAHASLHSGLRIGSRSETGSERSSEVQSSRAESGNERPAGEESALIASRDADSQPDNQVTEPERPPAGDRDRGHGNDADGVDEDNPGKSARGAQKANKPAAKAGGDHDRGHGNDADGVDEDNPGKSKGRKSK